MKIVMIILLFGWVDHCDYRAVQVEQKYYCEMVAGGRWPDYNGTYKTDCPAMVSTAASVAGVRFVRHDG